MEIEDSDACAATESNRQRFICRFIKRGDL
jgi:hypothetical protein